MITAKIRSRFSSASKTALALSVFALSRVSAVSKEAMLVDGGDASANASTDVTFKGNFLASAQNLMFSVMAIVTVGVFVYLGTKLVMARGNEEEFKKAWVALSYAVVGLALIPASYAIVRIVTGVNIF
ncbi:MAG: hypothetical protein QMC36_08250 [Patescibacteria group bacterium]